MPHFHWPIFYLYLSEIFVKMHHKYPVRNKYLMYKSSSILTVLNSLPKVIRACNLNQLININLSFISPIIPPLYHSCVAYKILVIFYFFTFGTQWKANFLKNIYDANKIIKKTVNKFMMAWSSHSNLRSASFCSIKYPFTTPKVETPFVVSLRKLNN